MELDEVLLSDIQNPTLSELYIQDFFVVMALCNTVVVTGKSHIHSIDEGEQDGWARLAGSSAHFLHGLLPSFLLSFSLSLFSPSAPSSLPHTIPSPLPPPPEFITAEHTKPGEMTTYISSITYEAESPDEAALVEVCAINT